MSRYAKYRQALRALRAECPVAMGVPVRVRLNHAPNPLDEFGKAQCAYETVNRAGTGITIVLRTRYGNRLQTAEELQEAIIHEWAHAMVENGDPGHHNCPDHEATWGVAYSRAYNAVRGD